MLTSLSVVAMTACGDDAEESSEAGRGVLTYHLAWIKNVEFAGNYIADQHGYYRDEGFERVEFISGGPNVSQDAAIQAGKAFIEATCDRGSKEATGDGPPVAVTSR